MRKTTVSYYVRAAIHEDLYFVENVLIKNSSNMILLLILIVFSLLNISVIDQLIKNSLGYDMTLATFLALILLTNSIFKRDKETTVYNTLISSKGLGDEYMKYLFMQTIDSRRPLYLFSLLLPLLNRGLTWGYLLVYLMLLLIVMMISSSIRFLNRGAAYSLLPILLLVLFLPSPWLKLGLLTITFSLLSYFASAKLGRGNCIAKYGVSLPKIRNFRIRLLIKYYIWTPSFLFISALLIYFGFATNVYSYQVFGSIILGPLVSTFLYGMHYSDTVIHLGNDILGYAHPSYKSFYKIFPIMYVLLAILLNLLFMAFFANDQDPLLTLLVSGMGSLYSSIYFQPIKSTSFIGTIFHGMGFATVIIALAYLSKNIPVLLFVSSLFFVVTIFISRRKLYGQAY